MSASPGRVRALSVHAGYRCGRSGACCTSGWAIPVEPSVEDRLRHALREGRLVRGGRAVFRTAAGHAPGARVALACDGAGRCPFLEDGPSCAVHRILGEAQLPAACRQYPRVATLTPLGVSVTLSHHCPTAAGLLFGAPGPPRIVADPPALADRPYEGLDAREGWPPLLRPGVLMTWLALERWEEHAVATFADAALAPERGITRLAACAERARAWSPERGDFEGHFAACLAARASGPADRHVAVAADERAGPERRATGRSPLPGWRLVATAVPRDLGAPVEPPRPVEALALVEEGWVGLHEPIRRWLAARAFASWLVLQGEGVRTAVLGLRVALDVLRVEAGRGCLDAGRPLDAALLLEALRRSDLLLVQLADPERLARALSRCEHEPAVPGGAGRRRAYNPAPGGRP